MNRKYTKDEYVKKVSYLRDYADDFPISTDIIVGYADETEDEYQETLNLLESIGFEEAYLYKYSEREGSIAYKKNVQYDKAVGARRLTNLVNYQRELAQKLLSKQVGKKTSVMVDDIAKDNMHYLCRSKENRIILVKKEKELNMGDIFNAEVTEIKSHTLIGKFID